MDHRRRKGKTIMATLPQTSKEKSIDQPKRGSEKLMKAWKTRTLTEESVREIASALDKSPAKVESFSIVGGENATGVRLSLRYDGDDGPWCGNDIQFWLQWLLKHGGHVPVIKPPRIIINGIPWPDVVRMELDFGQVETNAPTINPSTGVLGGGVIGG